jgi:hypothetical protein
MRVPQPGSRQERDVIAACQPSFLAACRHGVSQARMAQCADGRGNQSHTAVQSWMRFTLLGLRIECRRPLDVTAPLAEKLSEIDVIEAWAWWLVTQVGVSHETAKDYMHVVNAWHERYVGVALAGGMPLRRVSKMLDGLARVSGVPPPRRLRIGVRPKHLRAAIDAHFDLSDPTDANVAVCLEVTEAAVARAGEMVSNLPRGAFDPGRLPTRGDLRFEYEHGRPVAAILRIVNCKARGVEARRKVDVRLPMEGSFLRPGLMLWYLTRVVDPAADDAPLFRIPLTNAILSVTQLRTKLRAALAAINLDASRYGAHSLRIGGATALAWAQADHGVIKTIGRWRSDAYETYVRTCRGEYMFYAQQLCSADVDDFEADHLDLDVDIDESDYE